MWLTASALQRYLGISRHTMLRWIARGYIRAFRAQQSHYSDERPRATDRGQWRITEEEVSRFLRVTRGSQRVPAALRRRMTRARSE